MISVDHKRVTGPLTSAWIIRKTLVQPDAASLCEGVGNIDRSRADWVYVGEIDAAGVDGLRKPVWCCTAYRRGILRERVRCTRDGWKRSL